MENDFKRSFCNNVTLILYSMILQSNFMYLFTVKTLNNNNFNDFILCDSMHVENSRIFFISKLNFSLIYTVCLIPIAQINMSVKKRFKRKWWVTQLLLIYIIFNIIQYTAIYLKKNIDLFRKLFLNNYTLWCTVSQYSYI